MLIANDLLETIARHDAPASCIRDRLRRTIAAAKTVDGEVRVTLADWNTTGEPAPQRPPARPPAQKPSARKSYAPLWTEEYAANRQIALAQSDGICPYCLTVIRGKVHVDHMIPRSRGGTDDLDNLCVTCRKCNERKGAKTTREFFEWLEAKR